MRLFILLLIVQANLTLFQNASACGLSSRIVEVEQARTTVYPITSVSLDQVSEKPHSGRKQAVVVGAGIAGLTGALVLVQEGYDVVVLEKRSPDFNRFNMVNLKLESESILGELGLLDAFKREVATRLESHTYFNLEEGEYVQFNREDLTLLHLEEPLQVDVTHLSSFFKKDGLYTITIAEFQQFLAEQAQRTKRVSIVTEVEVALPDLQENHQSVIALQNDLKKVFTPDLVVLADGAGNSRSGQELFQEIYEEERQVQHPCEGEKWIFGNVAYSGTKAFVTVLIDKSVEGFTQMVNVIFDPRHGQANIAVSVRPGKSRDGQPGGRRRTKSYHQNCLKMRSEKKSQPSRK